MKKTFIRYGFKKVKNLLQLAGLIAAFVLFGILNVQAQKIWNGAGVSGGTGDNKLDVGANWIPATAPSITDSCVINLGAVTGSILLTIKNGTTSLSMKALTINLTGLASNTAVTKVDFNINNSLIISGSLTINNTSLSPLYDTVNFNIGSSAAGTVTCGSLTGGSAQNGVINIQNNTTFTVNDATTLTNTGTTSLRFITANGATTTLNGKTVIGTTLPGQWTNNLNNKILIGSTTNAANGTFVINGDSLILGFNMGTEKFSKGTILFNGIAKQVVSSYAKVAPDRVTGTIQIGGGLNLSKVYFEKGGGTENDALVVKNAVIVNNDCLLSVRTVAIPSDGSLLNPDGLIQLNAGATFVIGTKAGTSSSLPDSYKTYSFHPTSTVIYDGINRQIVYAGANYGNVEINGADTATKTSGGSLNILGNLLIQAGKTFIASDSVNKTITVKGNWTNNGTFIPKISTVSFDSSTNATIGGASTTDFYNLRINKTPGGSVTLSKDVTVSDTATLTEGELKLNGSKLTLNGKIAGTGTGTLTGSATSSLYIGGTGTLGTLSFTGGAQTLGELTMNRSGSGLATMGTNLSVGTTANFTIGAFAINGNTLTLNGIVNTTSGTLTGSTTSNLVIGGTANTLHFTPNNFISNNTTNNYLKTLTVNSSASVTIGDSLNIDAGSSGSPGVVSVNGTMNANGNLTIKSQSLSTARVGASSGTINGEVTVERYFPALRAWRFIGVPFSSSTQSINEAWQEGNVDAVLSCPPQNQGTPGYGTAISYNNNATNGFDANNTGNASLKVYSNNTWMAPTSTITTNIASPNKAYNLFVRGDRSVCLTYVAPPSITTLRAKGVLNQFAGAAVVRNFSSTNPGDYVLIGNPYASSVDIRNIVGNGAGIDKNKFLVWNPHLGGSFGVGGYMTYSISTDIYVPNDGTYTAGTVIQSGQAFMVQLSNSGTSGSVAFNESNKSASETPGVFGRQAAKRNPATIYVNLLDATQTLMDGVGAAFGKNFSAAVDSLDASKKWNEEIENMALVRDGKTLAIEFRPVPVATDTLFLRLYLRQHPYLLQIFSQNLPSNLPAQAWIVDKYLNIQTEINLYDTTLYTFTPNPDTNSYRNRFMLVYNRLEEGKVAKASVTKQAAANTIIEQTAAIYPNPVTGNSFNLVLSDLKKDKYIVNIYTQTGSLISTRNVDYQNNNSTYNLKLPSNTITGNYTVQVLSRRGEVVSSIPLIINK